MTNGLFMIGASIIACGGLAVSYRTLTAYILLRLNLMRAKIKNRLTSCGLAVRKNRYRLLRRTIRLEPTVAWPESDPHPPLFLDGPIPKAHVEPAEPWPTVATDTVGPTQSIDGPPPISDTKAGLHFLPGHEIIHASLEQDFRDIKELKDTVAYQGDLEFLAKEYGRLEKGQFEMAETIEQLEKNQNGMITICEKLTMFNLDLEKRLEITEDKLRDAIFILYEGKKANGE